MSQQLLKLYQQTCLPKEMRSLAAFCKAPAIAPHAQDLYLAIMPVVDAVRNIKASSTASVIEVMHRWLGHLSKQLDIGLLKSLALLIKSFTNIPASVIYLLIKAALDPHFELWLNVLKTALDRAVAETSSNTDNDFHATVLNVTSSPAASPRRPTERSTSPPPISIFSSGAPLEETGATGATGDFVVVPA